ncbi:MAG: 7-carboxy-7-deazaguanine synthase [Candidatus Methanogaster sp.]|nr:MAG: 7-carboxy-7-deazaguanine synthase [ANME-2 cluster archaeon]
MTPETTAEMLARMKGMYQVERVAFSGGECTLNRKFLIESIKYLKRINNGVRIHVDTNGSLLTSDYIDELVDAGMTDIGIDLKALSLDTFTRITAVSKDAERYLKTAWNAVKYILDNHDIFIGIGIPYNQALTTPEEIRAMGEEIAQMSTDVQVSLLDYRPAFKRRDLTIPTAAEMAEMKSILNATGLNNVIAQTEEGYIGP